MLMNCNWSQYSLLRFPSWPIKSPSWPSIVQPKPEAKKFDKSNKKRIQLGFDPQQPGRVVGMLPTQLRQIDTFLRKYLVYIINHVWTAVLQECRPSFQQNRLHSHSQSAVNGKLKRLETFRNKLADAKRRSFHFEQVWRRTVQPRPRSTWHKNSDEMGTDRRLFSFI